MGKHARLGPSNARWPSCPGSVREEQRYPDLPGEAAIDGTGSHELLEMCLKNGVSADAYDGQIICVNHHDMPGGWMVHADRIERVNMCLDYIDRRVKELTAEHPGATITVSSESKSDPGLMFDRTDWWGTVDVTIIVRESHTGECLFIEVIDYKDGRGWVNVPGNTQLLSYLGGKMRPFVVMPMNGADKQPYRPDLVKGCRITIVQPKTNPVVRYESPTPEEVMAEVERMAMAAARTDDPEAPLIADDKGGKGYCRWCKHKDYCNAETDKSLAVVNSMSNTVATTDGQSMFEYIGKAVADPTLLTVDQLAELADAEAGIQAAFDKVKVEIQRRIENDESVPGYAMTPGNGKSAYNESDEEIAKALKGRRMKKDQIFPSKLITPAALMKSDALTPDQKAAFEKKYISKVASNKLSLKKVAREEVTTTEMFAEVVAQSSTADVQSTEMMFGNVTPEEPSFF